MRLDDQLPTPIQTSGLAVLHPINPSAVILTFMTTITDRLRLYLQLIRMDRPIGSLLLLWPTWWGLWLAGDGQPGLSNIVIFTLGVFLTRSAGCVINDYADREFDRHVKRTQERPLTSGKISSKEALGVGGLLLLIAFLLVIQTNLLTVQLSVAAVFIASAYPFMKRHTHWPQLVLGFAFSWGIPMAFAAEQAPLNSAMWLLFTAAVIWTVVYDTFYAMVDRDDDLKIGIRSTAILFAQHDRLITALLQVAVLALLTACANRFGLGAFYYAGVTAGGLIFVYQQWLIRERDRLACFRAFLNNNYFGLAIFAGIVTDLSFSTV